MIPDWLARHLEATGKLGPDRIGRAARSRHCKDCGQVILTGLDADLCAGVVRVDPAPLAPLGEALAQIAGRGTYTLRRAGNATGRYELDPRTSWQITAHPAGTDRYDVLAAHTCDAVNLPTTPSVLKPAAAPADLEHPPY
jgi:hypothetical protein